MLAAMRTMLLAAALALVSAACTEKASPPAAEAPHVVPEISIADVAAGLEANTLTVVDCNGAGTRTKHGTLPGAILLDDEETFTASALPADKATKLVFYCGGRG